MDAVPLNDLERMPRWRRLASTALRAIVIAAAAAAALAWMATSILAIVNFAFRYPVYDQYRVYPGYLSEPFPASAMHSENGHHPILPILLRLADNAWWSGSQKLLLITGTLAAVGVLAALAWAIVRERGIPATTRAAAVLLSAIAVFWLGNARMLIHSNEQSHVYFTLLATALALFAMQREQSVRNGVWLAVAGFLCVCATFSFGTGLASFAAVFALALLYRLRTRHLFLLGGLAAATLWMYVFGLPGERSVRSALAFDPVESAAALTRWLSSPWMRSFLGTAKPPLDTSLPQGMAAQTLGIPLLGIAAALASLFGEGWAMREAVVIGSIGVCLYVLAAVHAWRHRATIGRARAFAFGMATFALGSGLIVCAGRLAYFAQLPTQVLADRYSPWTCVFWLGLGVYAMTGPHSTRMRQRVTAVVATLAIVLLFAPSHRVYAGWCAAAHRFIQQAAVASQLGILDPDRNVDVGSTTPADTLATVKAFRDHRIAMFAEPAYALVESGWHAPATLPAPLDGGYIHVTRQFDDLAGTRRVAAFEGWLPQHAPGLPRDPILVVVDAQGAQRGLAKISFDHSGKPALRYRVIRKRGFDGYVLNPQPGEVLKLLVMRKGDRALLASIPLTLPDAAIPAASSP
ncbi:MAG TPA: hypothetical protein VGC55_17825 [Dokdonella sp.]